MTAYQGQEDLDPLIEILKSNHPNLAYTGDAELDVLLLEQHNILVINVAGAVAVEKVGGELVHA